MIDARVNRWRSAVRRGELPADLVDLLRDVAMRTARRRLLPPSFAPYGQWDDEAAGEIFAAWYTDRLLGGKQLVALLDRTTSVAGLRALAERSLRQHLLNAADRSQAQNLFRRLMGMLRDGEAFTRVCDAQRPGDRWYALVAPVGPGARARLWTGSDRLLVAHGWALGDLTVIRYRAGAAKLSPVLDAEELARFVVGLLSRTETALTPGLVMRVLAARLDLQTPRTDEFDDEIRLASSSRTPDVHVALHDTARTIVADLTTRQRAVLRRADDAVASVAADLGCSVGTVVNERRRIGAAVSRLSDGDAERDELLNIAADLLYLPDDE
jgi:hypothetical protein